MRTRFNRQFSFASFLAVGLLMGAGCRDTSAPSGSAATRGGPTLKVALLHPGRENDNGWNQLAAEALSAVARSYSVTVQRTHSGSETTFKSDMRDFAQQGYDLVICHGGEYVKAAREVARDFPRTHFVITGSSDAGKGVATFDFHLWEATYLCGVVGAYLAPSGPAGLIGGQDMVTVRKTMDAFSNGIHSVRPEYATFPQYVGSWDDIARAQQSARSLIETRGVKIIFQNCDAAAMGVFQAAQQAKIYAFGANRNQNELMPTTVPASAIIDMGRAFGIVIEDVRAGKFEPKVYVGNLKNGVVDVALNSQFRQLFPPGTSSDYEEKRAAIIAGRLDVLAKS